MDGAHLLRRDTSTQYYFIDRERGIGGIVTTQLFPWGTPQMLKVRDEFERWCGAHIA